MSLRNLVYTQFSNHINENGKIALVPDNDLWIQFYVSENFIAMAFTDKKIKVKLTMEDIEINYRPPYNFLYFASSLHLRVDSGPGSYRIFKIKNQISFVFDPSPNLFWKLGSKMQELGS